MRIGIIGGTGPAGTALGLRLASSGGSVVLGSRSAERAAQIADGLRGEWPGRDLDLTGGTNEQAIATDVVVLATPWDAAGATVVGLREQLAGRLLVSMVNALLRVGREFQALVPVRGSVAATVQALLPDSRVAAAFQHLPAGSLAALDEAMDADVLVCADSAATRKEVRALVELVPGLRAISAGSLASANAVEAMTAVLLNVNVAYKTHVALRLTGLEASHR